MSPRACFWFIGRIGDKDQSSASDSAAQDGLGRDAIEDIQTQIGSALRECIVIH